MAWPRQTDADLERGDNEVMRAKEDNANEGRWPKRCKTGLSVEMGECEFCGAANGEACLDRSQAQRST